MFDTYQHIFQARGDAYHAAMTRWPHARRGEFHAVLERLDFAPGTTLLDMPSGGGYLRDYLPRGVHYIALETSSVFHDFCLHKGGIKAVLGKLDATGLPAASVDHVVSLAGMHHVEQRGLVYAEVHRLLRPGGRYVLADAAVGSPVAGFLNVFVDAHNSQGHQGLFLDGADSAALRQAGFRILSDENVPYSWRFAAPQQMVAYCKLLFGMDRLSSHGEGLEGIRRHLGFASTPDSACALNWGLRFVVALKDR